MTSFFWRVLFAAIFVVLIYLLIPPFVQLLGFGMNANLLTIVRVCIAGIVIFYVLSGPGPWRNA